MRVVLVAAALLMIAVSGCTSDPKTQDAGDEGSGSSCTASANATAASITCTTSGSKSGSKSGSASATGTKGPASNSTGGNATGGNSTVGGNVTGNATGNATGNQTAAPAQDYSCTVDVPTAGFSFEGSPAGNMGACTFTDTDAITILDAAAPADGCTITFDDNPDDSFGGADATVGSEYAADGQYGMECQLPASIEGGTGTITIRVK